VYAALKTQQGPDCAQNWRVGTLTSEKTRQRAPHHHPRRRQHKRPPVKVVSDHQGNAAQMQTWSLGAGGGNAWEGRGHGQGAVAAARTGGKDSRDAPPCGTGAYVPDRRKEVAPGPGDYAALADEPPSAGAGGGGGGGGRPPAPPVNGVRRLQRRRRWRQRRTRAEAAAAAAGYAE